MMLVGRLMSEMDADRVASGDCTDDACIEVDVDVTEA